MKKKAAKKSPSMALVKTEDLDKLLNKTWQISNDLGRLPFLSPNICQ